MSLTSLGRATLFIALLLTAGFAPLGAAESAADPLDWPMWRGPEQNGVSRETGLVDRWSPDGENLLWKSTDLATRSTPIIMRGKLYTLARSYPESNKEGEKVICADAATGKILWENKFNVFLSDVPDTRVGWSCCVGDPTTGCIYAMGVCGYLQCLDGETGKTIWSHSLNEEYGLLSTYGGRTNVPVIHEDLVIISAVITGWGEMSKPAHRFLAFNKHTGQNVWFAGTRLLPEDTTYSTPVLTTLKGQAAMVFGSGDGAVWAFQPRTGKPIWQYRLSRHGINVTPLVANDRVYIGHSEENREDNTMGALAAVNALATGPNGDITASGELWRDKEVMVGRSSMVLIDGRLYSADDSGNFYVHDAETGKQIGRRIKLLGTIMRASLLHADGKIYACTTNAWHVLTPTKDGAKLVNRMRMPEGEEIHGSPIVSHGRLYLPTTETMYCLALDGAKTSATAIPPQPPEDPIGDNTQVAQVQVVPVEALVKPGENVQYTVRVFNSRGQFLREVKDAEFSLEGAGQVSQSGQFTADPSASHSAVTVKAKVGDVVGIARVRVEPPLPWKFDFADKEVPITWVGARYRHVIREVEGKPAMVKITTIPKGTRSQSWMGPIDLHDYTIEADVRGAIKNGKMPDIGVIAQRYTFDMMGASQQVQIRSWTAQLEHRFAKTLPFTWKPDVWYTTKFRASVENGKAVLKGKVWERGQPEPETWTIEAVDEAPNVTGSPGLFGNANDAEITISRITVTPNTSN
jgi:outer membrane protein assembly factor BamB